ncbi:hypothetical protein KSW81_000723 [Nannochloris sp. 'desiccata']|nr:hypothetical protein KSW81_000723 [Chlorella desiccata (nom. nud.)]
MNTNGLRLQCAKSTELLPRNRLMAASIRSIPIPGGRYVCQASYKSNDRGDDVPTARSRTVEVAQVAAAATTKNASATSPADDAQEGSLDAYIASLKKQGKKIYDRVYYGDVFPPTGSFQLSYARLLELLAKKKVKRLVLLSDGRTAIVEIPVENTESDFTTVTYDRRDYNIQYADEVPEWKMEKNRYYCELPGDVWEEGTLMELIKRSQERRVWMNGQLRIPYENLLNTQFIPIVGLLALRLVVGAGEWVLNKFGKQKKSAEEEMAEQIGSHRAQAFNVEEETVDKDGKKSKKKSKKDTGVRYEDVAGIDAVKDDIRIILDILLGDEKFRSMGAHPQRPWLVKLVSHFFSANGAEFVEMFQGVAAARIRSLFRAARKASPSIIFIDEIDAIGKSRSDSGGDSGSAEREQGLLQLLTEMDGFFRDDAVLIIGATNLASALDEALLRPGRFDRTIHMGLPSPANRLRILQVHAKDKPIDRSNEDALLKQVADLAIGYSGAELANLLNEAAILAVRRDSPTIDISILKEAMEKVRLGLPHTSLPDSEAKRRYAAVEAARAVAFALTPGLPPLEHVTVRPRGGAQARILFVPQEPRSDGGTWHLLAAEGSKVNAVKIDRPLSPYELFCALMTPLYVPRCTEEILYGSDGASLLTSKEIAKAGELAKWIVIDSQLHPVSRDTPVLTNMRMGGGNDPTTAWKDTLHDEEILALQKGAYARARELVFQRKVVIEQVAKELCENTDETVLGSRIVELLETTPLGTVPVEEQEENEKLKVSSPSLETRAGSVGNGASISGSEALQEELGDILGSEEMRQLVEVVMGRVSDWDLVPGSIAKQKAEQARAQLLNPEQRKRLETLAEFNKSPSGLDNFPVAPEVPKYEGLELNDWIKDKEERSVIQL